MFTLIVEIKGMDFHHKVLKPETIDILDRLLHLTTLADKITIIPSANMVWEGYFLVWLWEKPIPCYNCGYNQYQGCDPYICSEEFTNVG